MQNATIYAMEIWREPCSQAESCMPQMETSSYKRWVLVSDFNALLIFFINIIKEYSILLYE